MKLSKSLIGISMLVILSFVLAACGGQEAATPEPEASVVEESEPVAENGAEEAEPEAEGNEEVEAETETAVTNAVSVSDQLLTENSITIDSVTADTDGWLVIHAQADGKPGPILGFAPVQAGENSSVVVEIDPAGLSQTLYAMLHVDAGTPGEYEFPGEDAPATDADGGVVTPSFALTIPNAVTVADQALTTDNTVTISSVTSSASGWLVIHAQADGKPGPILGQAPVVFGPNSDVVVEIDPAAATDTLYAMLHVDAGTTGEYEFPGDDVPAQDADGNVVTPPFQVDLTGVNTLTVSDQELGENNVVTVAAVRSTGPGWLVIHAQADGKPGPVIGFTAVAEVANGSLTIEIDAENITDTLYAMLHVDAGIEGEYEFPGDDTPAQDAEGNIVISPFTLSR